MSSLPGKESGKVFFLQKQRHRKRPTPPPNLVFLWLCYCWRESKTSLGRRWFLFEGGRAGLESQPAGEGGLGKEAGWHLCCPVHPSHKPRTHLLPKSYRLRDLHLHRILELLSLLILSDGELKLGEGREPKVVKQMLLISSALLGFLLLAKWASHLLSVPHWKASRENSLVIWWEGNWHTHCLVSSRGFHWTIPTNTSWVPVYLALRMWQWAKKTKSLPS